MAYCKSGHFRGTFIFALFGLNLATAKIKTCEYILYMSPSMEQKSKIANKKLSESALNWLTAKITTFTAILGIAFHKTVQC